MKPRIKVIERQFYGVFYHGTDYLGFTKLTNGEYRLTHFIRVKQRY
jgi:hypothetical protein